ncbi:DUF4266 domain-containing protein [Marinomonas sp. 15G1-11]|uniref:DUF4266 domain-containing protein n=1 Tax=Marinomonas phaeophyticola TaxID=3004091 RepID=A0ABT4JT08_9GAMM|nr:DUF4266 domain-containing protein [Marinomonas sp. 15G1-11]
MPYIPPPVSTSLKRGKPWEQGVLAQQEMNLISDPIESSLNDHIYFSKEASSGGQGFGGGGCGCN